MCLSLTFLNVLPSTWVVFLPLCRPCCLEHSLRFWSLYYEMRGFPGGTRGKEHACQCRRLKRPGFYPWVRKIPWQRAWQPTPVFLPGGTHRQKSLVGYSPQGRKELDLALTHNKMWRLSPVSLKKGKPFFVSLWHAYHSAKQWDHACLLSWLWALWGKDKLLADRFVSSEGGSLPGS